MTTTPHDDLVAHETGQGCACGPASVPVVTGDGDSFAITIHQRLDGLDALFAEVVDSWREPE